MTTKTAAGNGASEFTYERDASQFSIEVDALDRLRQLVADHAPSSPAQPALADLEAGRSTVHLSSENFLESLRSR